MESKVFSKIAWYLIILTESKQQWLCYHYLSFNANLMSTLGTSTSDMEMCWIILNWCRITIPTVLKIHAGPAAQAQLKVFSHYFMFSNSIFPVDDQLCFIWDSNTAYQPYPDSKVHGATQGPPGSCRTQMGPMLAPWTLLSGYKWHAHIKFLHTLWSTSLQHLMVPSVHTTSDHTAFSRESTLHPKPGIHADNAGYKYVINHPFIWVGAKSHYKCQHGILW